MGIIGSFAGTEAPRIRSRGTELTNWYVIKHRDDFTSKAKVTNTKKADQAAKQD
jgi:hypothetical protein